MVDLLSKGIDPAVTVRIAKIMQSTSFDIGDGLRTFKGVQQGSVISPSLFNVYIDSLIEALKSSTTDIHAWADDISFTCKNKQQLIKAINIAEEWCLKKGMAINKAKSGILALRKDRRTRQVSFKQIN